MPHLPLLQVGTGKLSLGWTMPHPPLSTLPLQILWKWIDKKTPPKPPNISISLKRECLYLFVTVLSLKNDFSVCSTTGTSITGRKSACCSWEACSAPARAAGRGCFQNRASGRSPANRATAWGAGWVPATPRVWAVCMCVCVWFGKLAQLVLYFHFPFGLRQLWPDFFISILLIFIFHLDSDIFDLM